MQLSIFQSGSRETLKGTVHGIALVLAALIGLYNMTAWLQRRERHLAVNTLVYTALVLFEHRHVKHHWTSGCASAATAVLLAAAAASAGVEDDAIEKKAA